MIQKDEIRVLIVDDEHLIRELLKRSIPWHKFGMTVVADTGNALEVLGLVEALKPQVIFMDICMPHITGVDLSEKLLEAHPECQVIILTGHQIFEDAKRCVNAGVSAFISKPINGSEIEETLHKISIKCETLLEVTDESVQQLAIEPLKQCSEMIESVKTFIQNHYQNPELSLMQAADKFYIHPNHLSRRFSNEQGITFKDYLLRVRLEAALALIQTTDHKNYEIAEKIGMVDPNYFCVYFKKMLNMTVGEYRKQHLLNKY
jgi:YesN/AraC family two-component response regulator